MQVFLVRPSRVGGGVGMRGLGLGGRAEELCEMSRLGGFNAAISKPRISASLLNGPDSKPDTEPRAGR
jgi:hypothetical protein